MGRIRANDQVTIGEILKNDAMTFKIPYNQRKYSWELEQVEKFWEDFSDLVEERRKYHYLGVLSLISTSEPLVKENEVIDGQQRLTTIILMMSAVRDIYLGMGDKKGANKIQARYLEAVQPTKSINKLTTSKVDAYTFDSLVNINVGERDEVEVLVDDNISLEKEKGRIVKKIEGEFINKNVLTTYNYFYNKMVEKIVLMATKDEKKDYLIKIEMSLQELEIILISSEDRASLYLFFDSLNNRGLKLSQMDILRNLFLRIISERFTEHVGYFSEKWDELVRLLDEYECSKFFKYYYMCSKHNKIHEAAQVPDIYEKYFLEITTMNEMKKELDKIIEYCNIYVELFTKEDEVSTDKEYIINVKRINQIGQQACHSFLMDYIYNVEDEDRRQKMTAIIEKMMYRRSIVGLSTKALDGVFKSLISTRVLNSNKYVYDDDKLRTKILEYMPTAEEFKASLLNKSWEVTPLIDYTLRKYEYYLDSKDGAFIKILKSRKKVNIEHILPQTITEEWLKYLNKSEEECKSQINRLGNLILLDYKINSSIKNSIYEVKIQDVNYGKSDLKQIKHLIDGYNEWNFDSISKRESEIIDSLLEIFKI